MSILIITSLAVNILVAGWLPLVLLDGVSMDAVYGPDSPARRILACLYGTIAAVSLLALGIGLATGFSGNIVPVIAGLLAFQVIYKVATAFVVGVDHPVVHANLMISALHVVTLLSMASMLRA